ncbi:MAG: alpha/beta hydrolase [Ignavibacteriales bacterium]
MDTIKRIGKKVMKVLVIFLGIIVCLNIIGFAVNQIFFSNELEGVSPYGQIVDVNQHKMHVYSMGHGEKTIVLLPGFGVALPSGDFGPLMRELSKEYTVVCIEYFGVGFSDQVDTPRTNENYMKEIRTALSLAGFKAPYVLMPHSASGIYSEYYAAKYPDEVSAIIMLDTTSTAKTEAKNPPKFLYGLGKVQQACGLTRLANGLVPPTQKVENGYTEKEISDYKLFANHVLNDTIIDQSYRMLDNINEVNAILFPAEIPVLKLISSQTDKKVGAEYQTNHLNRLGAKAESKIIDCSHFMYQTNAAEICEATSTFLGKAD